MDTVIRIRRRLKGEMEREKGRERKNKQTEFLEHDHWIIRMFLPRPIKKGI